MSKTNITLKDEPEILRYTPDITGLSPHIEERKRRTEANLQIVFNFFKDLNINPEYRSSNSLPSNKYVWASYINDKKEMVEVRFTYYESPYSGAHKTLSIYKDGNKKSNIKELRKLYS